MKKLYGVTMEEKIQFSDIDFTINLLSDCDNLSQFSCGCEELDLLTRLIVTASIQREECFSP